MSVAIEIIKFAALSVGTLWLLLVFFWACMTLKRIRNAGLLAPQTKLFGYPTLCVGLVIDFVGNVIPVSIILLEVPREWTVSSRLKRHNGSAITASGLRGALQRWRKSVAAWAEPMLDPADPSGDHI